jgi:protein-S-isoprenylcysteine O-methyltransferase Ste14
MIQRLRVPLGFVVAALVFYFATPTSFSIGAGIPIAMTGAIFRAMAAGVIRKDARLAISGVYSWTRNPLYFGSFMLALGFAVMSWNLAAGALLLVPFAAIYPRVIRSEEAHLERLFPEEFKRYRAAVPRFFPMFRRFHPAFSLSQYLANREYNTLLGLCGALAILIFKIGR